VADIFDLIDKRDVEGLKKYLSIEPSASGQRDPQGLSVLMRASYRGPDLVAIVRAADPPLDEWDRLILGESTGIPEHDTWSPDGFTPLHIAVFAKNAAATKALLAAGADPNVIAKAHFAKVAPLGTAVFVGSVEIARILLDGGADPKIPEGATPLMEAKARKNAELVALLESRS
jgi:uncharacterized protein